MNISIILIFIFIIITFIIITFIVFKKEGLKYNKYKTHSHSQYQNKILIQSQNQDLNIFKQTKNKV